MMYVLVLSTGNVVGANLFFPLGFGCCTIDGIGREARTCRHMVGPSSLTEIRGDGPQLPTWYQVRSYNYRATSRPYGSYPRKRVPKIYRRSCRFHLANTCEISRSHRSPPGKRVRARSYRSRPAKMISIVQIIHIHRSHPGKLL